MNRMLKNELLEMTSFVALASMTWSFLVSHIDSILKLLTTLLTLVFMAIKIVYALRKLKNPKQSQRDDEMD